MAESGLPHVVIAGGGLAGLSLAVALLARAPAMPVTVIEPRTAYRDDRTWCFWDVAAHPFADLVAQRWPAWSVGDGGRYRRMTAREHPYVRLPAGAVYEHAQARITEAPNAGLRLGTGVAAVHSDGVILETGGWLPADIVCDARPPAPTAFADARHPFFWQVFAGARVEAAPGTFDPNTVELMDFAVPQGGEIRFRYVLPSSDRAALVELTAFTRAGPGTASIAQALDAAIVARTGGTAGPPGALERGAIPMTTAPAPPPAAPGVIPLGTRAGAPRPASGYAFRPIQDHSHAVAAAILTGRPRPLPVRRPGVRLLDAIFLTALQRRPTAAPSYFTRLAGALTGDGFARFLMERAGVGDTLRVMGALPTWPLTGAGAAALWARRPRRGGGRA